MNTGMRMPLRGVSMASALAGSLSSRSWKRSLAHRSLKLIGPVTTTVHSGLPLADFPEKSTQGRAGRQISRRGDVVGYYVASVGLVVALILTMLEHDYFWIANTLYLSFVVATLVAGIVKLRAYRRGF